MRLTILVTGMVSFASAFLGGILAFSLVVPGVVEAQQNRLQAESMTIAGSDGLGRVQIGTGPAVNSHIVVLDANGGLRAQMQTGGTAGTNAAQTNLSLFAPGATGTMDAAVRLGTGADRRASLDLADQNRADRISLDVAPDGTPAIVMRDEQEVDRIRVSQGPGVASGVSVLDGVGNRRVTMATGGTMPGAVGTVPGSSALEIRDAGDGPPRARLGTASASDPVGEVGLKLRDQENRIRAVLAVAPDGTPYLQFLDAEGNVTWTAQ